VFGQFGLDGFTGYIPGEDQLMLLQIHHQFEDGHTDFIAQREMSSHDDTRAWMNEIWETDPPPMCAQFMFCLEGSKHFVKTHANRISDVCGLEGTKIDAGSHRMSDGFYESEFDRNNYR